MGFYYICGCDAIYGGLHGMQYDGIEQVKSMEEALQCAKELAWEVIDSYTIIRDTLEYDIREECECVGIKYLGEAYALDEEEMIRAERYEEDLEYYAIELDVSKLPTTDAYELDDLLIKMGSEEFLNKYSLQEDN